MNPFHVGLPLPPGPLLVEASAGTGKTWSIERLVARLLAEDPPEGGEPPTVDQVLVVTFTNAATAELRDRVRKLLCEAVEALEHPNAPGHPPDDPGFAVLSGTGAGADWTPLDDATLQRRAARLRRAVRDFDTAAISTIHGFCQRVLASLAFESGVAFDAELVEDPSAVVHEVVRDWIHRNLLGLPVGTYRWLVSDKGASLGEERLQRAAAAALAQRGAPVLPDVHLDWLGELARRAEAGLALAERFEGAEGDQLVTALEAATAAGALNGTHFKSGQLAGCRDDLVAWLRSRALPLEGEPNVNPARRFSARWIAAKAVKKGHAAPAHPLLDAVDVFFAAAAPGVRHAPLADFLRFVAAEVPERMRTAGVMGFDDLLHLVHAGLDRPELVAGLRARFRAALIDEFQDTDAIQWGIFSRVFLDDPTRRLVLIGDPKQAIYAFRGADVSVYTRARRAVPSDRQFTMTVNFRTDGPTVAGVAHLLGAQPNTLVHPEIEFVPVTAHHAGARLLGADGVAVPPVRVRWFDAAALGEPAGTAPANSKVDARLPRRVAQDVAALLASGATIEGSRGRTPLARRHVAVLVQTNRAAGIMHAALLAAGVPAVIGQSGSVFQADEARWLGRWLEALAEGGGRAARAFAATPLAGGATSGWTPALLAEARSGTEASPAAERWLQFTKTLTRQAKVLADDGLAAAFAAMFYTPAEPDAVAPLQRITGLPDAERRLTNLRHLAELLHAAATRDRLGPGALARWLVERRAGGDPSGDAADREAGELRLESDADTVTVQTMHKSKGLEYPVVFLPSLWDGRLFRGRDVTRQALRFHRPGDPRLWVDVRGLDGADEADAALARREILEERQRLAYVALTRARHHLVVYAGVVSGVGGQDLRSSPLGLLFHGAAPGADRAANADARVGSLIKEGHHLLRGDVEAIVESSAGTLALEAMGAADVEAPPASPATEPLLHVARFERHALDSLWRRESYSGLVGQRHGVVQEPGLPENARDHDDDNDDDDDNDSDAPREAPVAVALHSAPAPGVAGVATPVGEPAGSTDPNALPLTGFPGGPEAGSWVHGVFEHLSFNGGDPRARGEHASVAALVREQGARQGFATDKFDPKLVAALPGILRTPLGGPLGSFCLGDLPDGHRLDELAFDLAVGPGEDWQGHRAVGSEELASLLGTERYPNPMPTGYLEQVRQMGFRPLAGFLTGFIDLVFRAEVHGRPLWFVADYKSNTLGHRGPEGGRVVATGPWAYTRAFMAREVARKHYYLQYLVYLVALHRYLRWRVPGYDYERDVGGAAYLFVRGMLGPGTATEPAADGPPGPAVNGVFIDKPPAAVVEGLSTLLERVEVRP